MTLKSLWLAELKHKVTCLLQSKLEKEIVWWNVSQILPQLEKSLRFQKKFFVIINVLKNLQLFEMRFNLYYCSTIKFLRIEAD